MLPSYSRIDTPDKRKFYAPTIVIAGKRFLLKGARKTATEALNYAKRFSEKWIRYHAKEKVSSH